MTPWLTTDARAEEIVVSNYGVTVNGMPYAVAKALDFGETAFPEIGRMFSLSGLLSLAREPH